MSSLTEQLAQLLEDAAMKLRDGDIDGAIRSTEHVYNRLTLPAKAFYTPYRRPQSRRKDRFIIE